MCVICDRALPGLEESGWTDGEVTVCLGDRASVGVGHGEAMPESGWHPLPPQCGCEGLVAGDGTVLRLALAPSASGECGAAVRQAVPFAAILQGRVTLHAAAIACGGDIAAFTGASVSGKSRLAATLAGLGVRLVADDLLPCRNREGRVVAPVGCADGIWALRPLSRIYFLQPRDPAAAAITCVPMRRREAVMELVRNGFGELPVSRAWQTQFELYVRLAEQANAFRLRLPDGLDRLAGAADQIAGLLGGTAGAGASP